ncbi:hypothetical protein RchiOBHm_Chr7g0240741 [Rosa chinensis]|uniref:Uncharacterized protein n=1 Tax=Rosa chinensis TaxID=74649 RepID=A0A2P6PI17_ROSCH|nr:hypothetical protein RchiOBHm_Chr7g0240741 [Rosa chinensis]
MSEGPAFLLVGFEVTTSVDLIDQRQVRRILGGELVLTKLCIKDSLLLRILSLPFNCSAS